MVDAWARLLDNIIKAGTVDTFKSWLDGHMREESIYFVKEPPNVCHNVILQ